MTFAERENQSGATRCDNYSPFWQFLESFGDISFAQIFQRFWQFFKYWNFYFSHTLKQIILPLILKKVFWYGSFEYLNQIWCRYSRFKKISVVTSITKILSFSLATNLAIFYQNLATFLNTWSLCLEERAVMSRRGGSFLSKPSCTRLRTTEATAASLN